MSGIAIEGIRKAFGGMAILHDVSLELAEGEFLSLVGPSGCGKSTLLRIVAGLEAADAGRVWIGGRDVTALRPSARDVAMVFQNYALYPHLTVAENMAVPLAMRRLSTLGRLPVLRHLVPGEAEVRLGIAGDVRRAAELLSIGHLLDRRPAQLSGGQRQRVALGRAVVRRPAAFLMDEPLSNLDAELRARTRTEIVALHRQAGVATVYVTHDQVEAMTMSDRIAVMKDGRILQVGTPRALYDAPNTVAVAQFLGSPRINLMQAVAAAGALVADGVRLPIQATLADGCAVTVGIRAEAVRLSSTGALPAVVTHVEYLGSEVLLHTSGGGAALVARLPGGTDVRPGDAVRLTADWASALLFGADGERLVTREMACA